MQTLGLIYVLLALLIVFVGMGYLVAIIARRRGRPFGRWFWFGGFFGLLALIALLSKPRIETTAYRGGGAKGQKPCPRCHEWIDPGAVTCPHCQADLRSATVPPQ